MFGSKIPVLLFIVPAPLGETVQVPAPAPPVCVKVTGGADWQMVVGPFSTIVGQAQFIVIVCEDVHPLGDSVTTIVYVPFDNMVASPSGSGAPLIVYVKVPPEPGVPVLLIIPVPKPPEHDSVTDKVGPAFTTITNVAGK